MAVVSLRCRVLAAAVALALLVACADARRSSTKRRRSELRHRQRDCSRGRCSGQLEADPNCVLRCVHEACWREVYPEGRELEPGEVDKEGRLRFDECFLASPADKDA